MTPLDIARARLHTQHISSNTCATPHDVVSSMGAVQAQDYLGAFWAVGLRMKHATQESIEQALSSRSIVRTWPMRGTLHFVAAEDARWMLKLMGERVLGGMRRRMGQLDLNDSTISKARSLVMKALHGGKQLTRRALYDIFNTSGIAHTNSRGLHLLGHIALEGHICFGARDGKQQTFAILEEWVPMSKSLTREESLAELARRYFSGHGPATLQDCMWWSGLPGREVKEGIELSKAHLGNEVFAATEYWFSRDMKSTHRATHTAFALPPFDEFLVGYRNRTAALDVMHNEKVNPGSNGMLSSVLVIDGQVVGTWKRAIRNNQVHFSVVSFKPLSDSQQASVQRGLDRYAMFIGLQKETPA